MKKIAYSLIVTAPILFFLFFNFNTNAQNFDNYTNIRSSGKIPQDFLILSSSKFLSDKNTIDKNEEKFIKKTKSNFYLESNFLVNELLHNGKVLYNDPIGIYVNKVLASILENKPELKNKVRAYVVLSDIVNAYATNNGIIFINIGLLAKLENEAQLAFILGHEVTHYEKNHVLNRYVLNEQIEHKRFKISYSDAEIESILFSETTYAKDQEIEADIESTKLLLGTRYNPRAGIEVMKILASNLPLKSKYPFSPDFLQKDSSIQFNFRKTDFNSIEEEENDYDAESKTHPALSQRSETIKALSDSSDTTKLNFIFPEQEFYSIQKTAQFEVAKIFLQKGNFLYAFYCIHQLLQDNPNNTYLNDLLCKSFYLLSKLETTRTSVYSVVNSITPPRELEFISTYIDQLNSAELNILSIYMYVKTNPDPALISKEIRLRDLLYDTKYNGYNYDYCQVITSGYKTIEQIPYINQYIQSLSSNNDPSSIKVTQHDIVSGKQKKNTIAQNAAIDNIIILDPMYRKFDLRKKRQEKYIASEKALLKYNEQIERMSDELKIKNTIVSSIGWSENDTIAFHNHSLFKRQIEEIFINSNTVLSTDFELVDSTCQSYNSNHLALMGTYSFHIQKPAAARVFMVVWTAFLFPTLPIGIYYAATPSYKTYTYLLTINSQNQNVDYKSLRCMKYRDSMGAINSSTYYQLLKMKKGK